MSIDLYSQYTSTHALAEQEEAVLTEWSRRYFHRFILPHLPPDKDIPVLDCGCDYGRYVKALNELKYTQVHGIDLSVEQVDYARNKLGLTNVEQAEALSFLDGRRESHGVILMMDILEHLPIEDSIRLLSAARGSLCSNGRLIVQAPNGLCPFNVYRYADLTHQRAYTVKSLGQSLRLAGFVNMTFYPLPPLVHDVSSGIRSALWRLFINPAIHVFFRLCHGPDHGGIFTGNLLAVARK